MRKLPLLMLLPLALTLALGCAGTKGSPPPPPGSAAPAPAAPTPPAAEASAPREKPVAISLPRFPSGDAHDLATDRGQVVLLDFWATWCTPCRESLPTYQKFLDRYGKQGLRVYAVSVDEDPNQVKGFIEKFKIRLPVLIDQEGYVAEQQLGVRDLPTTFILDRKGRIRSTHIGWEPDSDAIYEDEIKKLLAEKD